MILTNTYSPNNVIRLSASFYDINNALADPTTVLLFVSGPNGTSQFSPTRDGVGLYHYDYTTATPGGKWHYRYQGFGAVKAQSLDVPFTIQIPLF